MTNIFTQTKTSWLNTSQRFLKSFVMLLLLIGANTALAQINYVRTTFTSAYTPITVGGGATQINVGTGLGDFSTTGGVASGTEGSAHILWPFNFTYNGVSFTTASDFLGISTNGMYIL